MKLLKQKKEWPSNSEVCGISSSFALVTDVYYVAMDHATWQLMEEIQKETNPSISVDGYVFEDYPNIASNPSDVDLGWLDEDDPPTEDIQQVIHAIRHWKLTGKCV